MFWRFFIVGLVCFFLGTGAAMLFAPMQQRGGPQEMPSCPFLDGRNFSAMRPEVIAAAGSYEAIRETLARASLDGVAAQAEVIARAFETGDPQIAACAKKVAGAPDIESARRAFLRLHRLMAKHAQLEPQE